jgi:hypothetical protein
LVKLYLNWVASEDDVHVHVGVVSVEEDDELTVGTEGAVPSNPVPEI